MLRAVTVGLRGDVRFDAPLKEWTSFRIGGPADVLVIPEDVEDLCRLLRQAHEAKISVFVVGGTNLLIRDGGIRGVVVSLSKLKAIADEPGSVVYAEGGVTHADPVATYDQPIVERSRMVRRHSRDCGGVRRHECRDSSWGNERCAEGD